jgi:aryl-alcohol dehydrogenase-like predicted oxidoreductase
LGRTDLTVSRLGLGTATWGSSTPADDAALQLRAFVDAGGTLVDTADVYGAGRAETTLGGLLGTVVSRDEITLATKAAAVPSRKPPFPVDASKRHLLAALDASLRRLGTDHVDLWQLHAWDPATPLGETLEALDTAVSSGRVRAIGVCNYAGWQLASAVSHAPVATVEAEYSLLERGIEREVLPAARYHGVGVLAWAPLGRGVLTGKYRSGVPEERRESRFFAWYVGHFLRQDRTASIVDTLVSTADGLGVSPLEAALAWVRDRPGVAAPIVGARTVDQLRESLRADAVTLPDDARARLDEVSAPYIGYPEGGLA